MSGKKDDSKQYEPPFETGNGGGESNPPPAASAPPPPTEKEKEQPRPVAEKPADAQSSDRLSQAEFAYNLGLGLAQAQAQNATQGQNTVFVRDMGDDREQDIIIDDDDYIPEGYAFFAPRIGLCLSVERRGGKDSRNPLGRKFITFEPYAEQRYTAGKEENVYRTSRYITHSHKEKAWLKESPLYTLLIFDNSSGATTPSGQLASQLISSMQHMQNMSFNQVVAMAGQYDVEVSDNLQQMRGQIAGKLAVRMFNSEVAASAKVGTESAKVAQLFKEGRAAV